MHENGSSAVARLISSLNANAASLKARGMRGELLVIEDLFDGVASLPDGFKVFCLDTDTSPNQRSQDEEEISPGLSFLWTSAGIEKFGSADRLQRSVSDFRMQEIAKAAIGKLSFEYLPNGPDAAMVVHALASGVESVVTFSLNALNKSQDTVDTLSRELLLKVEQVGGHFGLLDLTQFLEQKTGLSFGLLHLTRAPDGLAVMTASREASSEESLAQLSQLIGPSRRGPLVETDGDPNPFPTITLPQSVGAELIANAARWGRALTSALPNETGIRILLLPITRHLGPRTASERSGAFAASDILFTFTERLSRDLIERLRTAVNTFSQHRYGARRLDLLSRLQEGILANHIEGNNQIDLPRRPLDAANLKQFISSLLNEVLYTTSAHSVSLRLYEPKSQSLVVEAVADPTAENEGAAASPIFLKNSGQTSVTAFVFLNGGPRLPFVYLRRISQPRSYEINGRTKVRHSTFIPDEYKRLGLQIPMITRLTTRSEICFPLMRDALTFGPNSLAFGTLNLEAPFPSAFDIDLQYLRLVQHRIERLYNSVAQGLDHRWLIAQAARSDAMHEIWQLLDSKTYFTKKQDKELRSIFPQRSQLASDKPRNLQTLKGKVLAWAKTRYAHDETGPTVESIIRMIKFDHLSDCLVKDTFFESAFVILRNIVQNAVKHGDIENDMLFIDDRRWFGTSAGSCLRVHYQSASPPGEGVIDALGKKPIEVAEVTGKGKRIAYGMFNVGLLTRLLGGNLHVYSPGTTIEFVIEIHLPYEPEERDHQ